MVYPETLMASITAASVFIIKNCDEEEAALIASVFTQFGDTISTLLQTGQLNIPKKPKETAEKTENETEEKNNEDG